MHQAGFALSPTNVREEPIARQVVEAIARVGLDPATADRIIRQLENDRETMANEQAKAIAQR